MRSVQSDSRIERQEISLESGCRLVLNNYKLKDLVRINLIKEGKGVQEEYFNKRKKISIQLLLLDPHWPKSQQM